MADNDSRLRPYITEGSRLTEIDSISLVASRTAAALRMEIESGGHVDASVLEDINFLENGENGVILAIAPGLRQLASGDL